MATIDHVRASVFTVPTETPESDGTLTWNATTMVLVEASGGGQTGIGYSYSHTAAADVIETTLVDAIRGLDPMAVPHAWNVMVRVIRNIGWAGVAAAAVSAVDAALWDLKARLLQIPLVTLLGSVRNEVAVYGSGGFTSDSVMQLQEQLGGWVGSGIRRVKMKVGRTPREDPARVAAVREAIGGEVELFVDANGAYSRKQALVLAEAFAASGVRWFEEPVSSDDLDGLRLIRDRGPAGMDIAAGEYGYDPDYFRRMLAAGAVDVLQADATRCGGITGFMKAAALCEAHHVPLSAHTAPALHLHLCCAATPVRHVEYFHDHVRIERMFFDGVVPPIKGSLQPDRSRPGLGVELKRADAARFRER